MTDARTSEKRLFKVQGIPIAEHFPRQAICVTLLCEADLTYQEARNMFDWLKKELSNE